VTLSRVEECCPKFEPVIVIRSPPPYDEFVPTPLNALIYGGSAFVYGAIDICPFIVTVQKCSVPVEGTVEQLIP
jgi:hypothetical protein